MRSRLGLASLIVVILCIVYVSWELVESKGDPLEFVIYDGHYSYQIAYRIFGEEDLIPQRYAPRSEFPSAYRFQRILHPLLARLLAFNRPDLVPWTLIFTNIVFIGLGTLATEFILRLYGVSSWYALAYGLYGGMFISLRSDMIEPLSTALIMFAILAWLRRRELWTIIFFTLALLAKETAILFIAAFVIYHLISRDWRQAARLGISILPYAFYQVFLWQWLGEFGISTGKPFVWIPFGGWLMAAQISFSAFLLISILIVPIGVIPTIVGFILSVRCLLQSVYSPYVFSMLLHGIFILFLPTLTFRESSATIRVVQGLAVSILLYGASVNSKRILNYSLLWVFSNVLILGT